MLSNDQGSVTLDLSIKSGFEWSTAKDQLELFIDVIMTIKDPQFLLTSSNDPSYINREVWVQSTIVDPSTAAYETVKATVVGAGITLSNYESFTSRIEESSSDSLNGLQFVQTYDVSSG